MTDSPDPVVAGEDLTYSIVAKNLGPAGANGVTVSDTLPASASFVSSQSSQGTCTGTSTVTCNLGKLTKNATATVSIVARPTEKGTLSNTASVNSDRSDPEPTDNSVTVSTVVNDSVTSPADLMIEMTADKTQVKRGEAITYELTFENIGKDEATGVSITDALPSGLQFESCTNGCSVSEGQPVSWLVGSVPGGTWDSVALTVRVADESECEICNVAQISSDETTSVSSNPVCAQLEPTADPANAHASGSATGAGVQAGSLNETLGSSQSSQSGPGVYSDSDEFEPPTLGREPKGGRLKTDLLKTDLLKTSSSSGVVSRQSPFDASDPTFKIEGTWSHVEDESSVLNGSIAPGETFVASVTLDLDAQDSSPDPTVGDYWHRSSPYGIRIESGGHVFETNPEDVEFLLEVVNRATDNFLLRSYNNIPLDSSNTVDHISWQLDDESGTALSDDQFPDWAPDLMSWESIFGLTITGNEEDDLFDNDYFIRGHVHSITPANEAVSRSFAEVSNVSLLDGLISASLVRSAAEAQANGFSAGFSADGSMISGLFVNGVPVVVDAPNTRIELSRNKFGAGLGEGSYVVFFEQTGSRSSVVSEVTNYADLSVNMIRVHIEDNDPLALGEQPVDLIVGRAEAHANFPRTKSCSFLTFRIEGTWSDVDDQSDSLNGSITSGERFVGIVTLDTTAQDSNTDDTTVGDYWHGLAPYGIRIESGGLVFETDPENVEFLLEVVNRARDNYLLRSYKNLPLSSSNTVDHISWQLDDPSGTALSNDLLPDSAPDLTKWESLFGLTITGNEEDDVFDNDYSIRGHVDSVSISNPGT